MSEVLDHVGSRIRLYRKNKNMSMEELAALIRKSKATVFKYEKGSIAIDIETLFDIANALHISINQLTDYAPIKKAPTQFKPQGIFNNSVLYMYFYDGRMNGFMRGFIQIFYNPLKQNSEATMYMGTESFAHFTRSEHLYYGDIAMHDMVTNLSFENQANHVEKVSIIVLNPLGKSDKAYGLLCGISGSPIMPIAFKCVISVHTLLENEALKQDLSISKDDFRTMRKYNLFTSQRLY